MNRYNQKPTAPTSPTFWAAELRDDGVFQMRPIPYNNNYNVHFPHLVMHAVMWKLGDNNIVHEWQRMIGGQANYLSPAPHAQCPNSPAPIQLHWGEKYLISVHDILMWYCCFCLQWNLAIHLIFITNVIFLYMYYYTSHLSLVVSDLLVSISITNIKVFIGGEPKPY